MLDARHFLDVAAFTRYRYTRAAVASTLGSLASTATSRSLAFLLLQSLQRTHTRDNLAIFAHTMLLEAGLKKDDDNKAVRRWSANPTTYVSYEQWLKRLGVGLFSFWVVFALFYVSTSSSTPSSLASGASALAVDGAAQTNNNKGAGATTMENAFPDETNFLVIGDYGTGSADQVQTAETLKRFASTLEPRPAFVLSTGDQIYEHGCVSLPAIGLGAIACDLTTLRLGLSCL